VTFTERIGVLTQLSSYLSSNAERVHAHVHRASVDNPWFTEEFTGYAIGQIIDLLSNAERLRKWAALFESHTERKRVGIIMAGNIPMVGFHDLLCVFISGNTSVIKLSEKDKYLMPFLIKVLTELNPAAETYFEVVEKLKDFDAVIATGSNNSARYFEQYFAQCPHIIRRNRNAVAVLKGNETDEQLDGLCDDIFLYFGMGCRNVSHCFVPPGYDFTRLITRMSRYHYLSDHNKFRNNLEYNLALFVLNRTPHMALPNLILVEQDQLISPVSTLFYSSYEDIDSLGKDLIQQAEEIQCVVSNSTFPGLRNVAFGDAQRPALADYADGIDTLAFLQSMDT